MFLSLLSIQNILTTLESKSYVTIHVDGAHLKFEAQKVEHSQSVFSMPKIHLVSIELNLTHSLDRGEVKKLMGNCANGTKVVEKFICWVSPYFIEAFDSFIEKNRTTLRYIELFGYDFANII